MIYDQIVIQRIEARAIGPDVDRYSWASDLDQQYGTRPVVRVHDDSGIEGLGATPSYSTGRFDLSILETLRHLVGADSWYLYVMTGERTPQIDEDNMDIPELRAAMEADGAAWSALLAEDPDPDHVVVGRHKDGSETHAPMGIRLAQALHHGTDHRRQICTALTTLGVEPPLIDVWDFGAVDGQVVEIEPAGGSVTAPSE